MYKAFTDDGARTNYHNLSDSRQNNKLHDKYVVSLLLTKSIKSQIGNNVMIHCGVPINQLLSFPLVSHSTYV